MGSTGTGGASRRSANGERIRVGYTTASGAQTGGTATYEQRKGGVYRISSNGKATKVNGVSNLSEIRRRARQSGNTVRKTK